MFIFFSGLTAMLYGFHAARDFAFYYDIYKRTWHLHFVMDMHSTLTGWSLIQHGRYFSINYPCIYLMVNDELCDPLQLKQTVSITVISKRKTSDGWDHIMSCIWVWSDTRCKTWHPLTKPWWSTPDILTRAGQYFSTKRTLISTSTCYRLTLNIC